MHSTVIIGLGNPLRSDDGIGVRLIAELERLPAVTAVCDLVDAGTEGMRVLHEIAGRQRVIIIDAANLGAPPGALRSFRREDVRARAALAHMSCHEANLLAILDLAERVGDCPDNLRIFAIQPHDLSPGLSLSPLLESRIPAYLRRLMQALGK
jgi:hydrogenase maturation protease